MSNRKKLVLITVVILFVLMSIKSYNLYQKGFGLHNIQRLILGVPSYSQPFDLKLGKTNLDFSISRACVYQLRIKFISNSENGDIMVKNTFIEMSKDGLYKYFMPIILDAKVISKNNNYIFEKYSWGGSITPHVYVGPNPIQFISFGDFLEPGEYKVTLNVKEIQKDFSGFKTEVVLSGNPKTDCGSRRNKL